MNIAVCDDEKIVREQMREWIKEQCPGSEVDTYGSGEELFLKKIKYDIIFLDIQMEGMNGIETARQIRKTDGDAVLIFITGMKEYVFEAFDVAAFHYLLKPLQKEKFHEVLKRAEKEAVKNRECSEKKLMVRIRGSNMLIDLKDIRYIESQKRKAEIHVSGEVLEMYATMKELEQQLDESFYRCHRSYFVNMAYISEYNSDSISLTDGEEVYLAKGKYPEFVKTYMRFLRNGGGNLD